MTKIPGIYNENGSLEFTNVGPEVKQYDFLNLNTTTRTSAMQAQFEIVENVMKTQLKTDQFEDFFSPIQTCQRVCGRVINISTEDAKMKEQSIGLFNATYEADCRLRLNMAEVP